MSGKFVFNGQVSFEIFRDINEAVKAAAKCGYRFICWNSDVFFIDHQGVYHETGISADALT